jgi:LysM repeat protein
MSPQTSPSQTKVCPTCGSRLSENATKCVVCGRTITPVATAASSKPIQSTRMPEVTLSLPIAIGIVILVLAIGAAVVFAILNSTDRIVQPTVTPTITITPTITLTSTASPSPSPLPSFTPLPPLEYFIKQGDSCSTIAAINNVSIISITTLNNLPPDCGTLYINQKLLIPQPTPTASPLPSATLSQSQVTEQACEKVNYTVGENDTLSAIAGAYRVSQDAIKTYNGLTTDIVYQGQILIVPLCERLPTPGPTPTPTPPPPYLAPNVLLPVDGSSFTIANETISLQWASVGELRENEAYSVTVEDVTEGPGRKLVDYVTDTKYIVPAAFRPVGAIPHVIRWWVQPVRQTGTTKDGQPIWETAGAASFQRVFSWWGAESVTTPTP